MLPTVSKTRSSISTSRPNAMFPQYLRRIVKWQQMDIEYTFWQMLHLCTAPKIVYQHTKYHKQTKNQWARDEPAFVVICSLLLAVATVAYCAAYDHSAAHAVSVVISVLLFHFLLAGILLATCCWFLTNAYLREEAPNTCVVEQRVEWLYAFDVHCNSFFPMFVMLHCNFTVNDPFGSFMHNFNTETSISMTNILVFGSNTFFFSPLLVAHGFIPALLSNLLFMVAASYHHYLNFLGYDVLTFLERTTFFLYPIAIVIILSSILILSGFNPSRYFMNIYFSRLL
ncbi:hypothetical protein J1N35_003510 [Gossypium stocksii]|uniref:UNC-50 family protein n=1 Tax=Gossypium stocksii TaxID=47602 RepID=A0A9D4AHD5_9ROSI|nr:hypothetical protein J1N35_003510 [Gossypium stocksii]